MAHLDLYLLGTFRLTAGASVEVRLPTRKAEALLAYLALAPDRAQPRDKLAALLWAEKGDRQARHSLSQTLFAVRKALATAGVEADPLLAADGKAVALDPAAVEVDALRFERLAAAGTPEALAEAEALYRGELLEGLSLGEEPAFEQWLIGERTRLCELALDVLAGLLEHEVKAGAPERALRTAMRLVALDPLREQAHRALMRLYAAQGRRGAALKQYELCARALERELGVEPEAETKALYREFLRGRGGAAAPGPAPVVPPRRAPADERPEAAADGAAGGAVPAAALAPEIRRSPGYERAGPGAAAVRAVGREAELVRLDRRLDQALRGTRRVVLVTGEAGLGKTTLVEAFLDEAQRRERIRIGRGQCLEHRGAGEAYMPVLEALGRLCSEPDGGPALVALLARRAPSWLVQMPWLVDAAELDALQRRALGATRDRMLREMVEALEAIAADAPLVLVLEDLHWSDPSTVDLLARLAQRREPARLLVLGTYRPADARTGGHPLHAAAQEMRARGHVEEMALAFLNEGAVGAYLAARFPGAALPAGLARLLHERTEGNPLFMGNVVDSWVDQGLLVEADGRWTLWAGLDELATGVPESLRRLIEHQLERLDPGAQEVLEAASVAGREFSAALVAAAVDGSAEEDVEAACTALARRGQFLHPRGTAEWEDGTVAARYGFIHDLYQEVLYDRVPAGRRARLHQRIGARLEAGYGPRHARESAAELAVHFVRGRDAERAVAYLRLAADQALQRSAHREAIGHLTAALEALRGLPDGAERTRHELVLQVTLAPALIATEGWAAAGAERAYVRAHELCRQLDDPPQLSQVLYGLATLYEYRGEYRRSQALVGERLRLPDHPQDAVAFLESHELLACSLFHQGAFARTVEYADLGLGRRVPRNQRPAGHAADLAIKSHAWAALALWFLGYPDRALARADVALALARETAHAYGLSTARFRTAIIHQLRGEPDAALEQVEASLALAHERGFPHRVASGMILKGWALAARAPDRDGEAFALMHDGLAACRRTGTELDRPYFLGLLADAHARRGRTAEGLAALEEALAMVSESRSFFYEAELHRLRGSLLLRRGGARGDAEAEACFRRALDVGRRQEARSLELRAAIALARLPAPRGGRAEAHRLLADLHGRFAEGFDTADLRRAKALLDEPAGATPPAARRQAAE